MNSGAYIFSILVEANPPEESRQYVDTKRYGIIVFARANTEEEARPIAREAIARAGWSKPLVKEIARLDGKTRLKKFFKMNLEPAIRAAATSGYSMVVYDKPIC